MAKAKQRTYEELTVGAPCTVHYNLKTHLWSVTIKTAAGERVKPCRWVTLRGATAKLQAGGAAKIRARQCRKVVAWIPGVLESWGDEVKSAPKQGIRVHFHPYRSDTFHSWAKDEMVEWTAADRVDFTDGGAMTASA